MVRTLSRRERLFLVVGGVVALALVTVLVLRHRPAPSPGANPSGPSARPAVPEITAEDGPIAECVARMREAGEPTSLREATERGAPEDEVGAPWISIRMATLVLDAKLELDPDFHGDPPFWPWRAGDAADSADTESPENLARLAALAPRLESTCDWIAEALQAPRCRFPFDEEDAPENAPKVPVNVNQVLTKVVSAALEGEEDALDEALSELGPSEPRFTTVNVRLTAQKALAGAAVGAAEPARRLGACKTLLLFGRRDEPTTILDLSGVMGLLSAGVEVLRYGVERGTLDPVAARGALDAHLAGSAIDRFPTVLAGERAKSIDMYRLIVISGFGPDARRTAAKNIVVECDAMGAVAALRQEPVATWLRAIDRIAAPGGSQTVFLPSMARKLAQCDAATRLARVALAVAEHRATHGDLPASLDDLKPAFPDGIPLDPFTDRLFDYARTDAGARIASAGRLPDEPPVDAAELRERCLVWELKR